jgi:hypothetical protein
VTREVRGGFFWFMLEKPGIVTIPIGFLSVSAGRFAGQFLLDRVRPSITETV